MAFRIRAGRPAPPPRQGKYECILLETPEILTETKEGSER